MNIIFRAFVATFLCVPIVVQAHAVPIETRPAANSLSADPVDIVIIRFSERVESGASSIRVFDPRGSDAANGVAVVDENDPHILTIPAQGTSRGSYAVSWQVVSADDGHFSKGAFVFSVGSTSASVLPEGGVEAIDYRPSIPEATAVFLELLGQALILAMLFLYPRFRRVLEGEENSASILRRCFSIVVFGGGTLVVLGAVGYLLLRGMTLAELQGVPSSQGFALFFSTSAGMGAAVRAALGVVVMILLYLFTAGFGNSRMRALVYSLSIAVVISAMYIRASISHAAASEFAPGFSVAVNFIHVVFKDLWIGGSIVALSVLLSTISFARDRAVLGISRVFTRLTFLSLIFGGVTGTYIVWLHLKDVSNVLTTGWGRSFLLLSAMAGVLLLARVYNIVIERRLADKIRISADTRPVIRQMRKTYAIESVVALIVLFLSSVLIITTPPLGRHGSLSLAAQSQGADVLIYEKEHQHGLLFVSVRDSATGAIESVRKLTMTAYNEEFDIGPILVETNLQGAEYVFSGSELSPAGSWRLDLSAAREGKYDAIATFTFTYPLDNRAHHVVGRSFDELARQMSLSALLVCALAYGLFRFHRRSMRDL